MMIPVTIMAEYHEAAVEYFLVIVVGIVVAGWAWHVYHSVSYETEKT